MGKKIMKWKRINKGELFKRKPKDLVFCVLSIFLKVFTMKSIVLRMKQMLKKSRFIKKYLFLLLSILFLPACFFNTSGVNTMFSLPSVGSDFAPADSELFYIDLDVDRYESNKENVPYYEISTTEEYGDSIIRKSPSNCEIEHIPSDDKTDRVSTETIICILDVPEFEFMVRDLHLIYNFPEGMCEDTAVALPWHFNYPIYRGPVVEECGGGDSGDDPDAEEESGYRCNTQGLSTCNGTCYENEEDLCPHDEGGPICCSGGEQSSGEAWEPDREKCFGGPGPAVKQSDFKPFENIFIQALPDGGLRRTISLTQLLELSLSPSNVSHANYLKDLDRPPGDLSKVKRSTLPVFLQRSSYEYPPRLFFQFACLDSAGEVLHEILLLIREWNTFEEFIAFHDSGGRDEGDPDVEGDEGEDCVDENRLNVDNRSHRCNDLNDLEDYSSSQYPKVKYGSGEDTAGPGE